MWLNILKGKGCQKTWFWITGMQSQASWNMVPKSILRFQILMNLQYLLSKSASCWNNPLAGTVRYFDLDSKLKYSYVFQHFFDIKILTSNQNQNCLLGHYQTILWQTNCCLLSIHWNKADLVTAADRHRFLMLTSSISELFCQIHLLEILSTQTICS